MCEKQGPYFPAPSPGGEWEPQGERLCGGRWWKWAGAPQPHPPGGQGPKRPEAGGTWGGREGVRGGEEPGAAAS